MSTRQRAARALQRRAGPRVVAGLGSLVLSVRGGAWCAVRHDDGLWIHRYRDGVLVDTRLGGPTPARQDRYARDVFLWDYVPRVGDTVVDVGAGVGGEVRLFSRLVGPLGRVISVEAHPRTARALARTVAENGLRNVAVVACAVVERSGPVHLEDGADHIRNGVSATGVAVPGRTLDDLVAEFRLERIDLLKMNIEGAERAVLSAAPETLARVRHLTVSCHDFLAGPSGRPGQRTFDAVAELLRGAGFAVRTRPDDARPWIPYYVYAAARGGTA
ncbi:FkbM family methyltransferase [Jidongwangia harbinensis]|uniref:FkbM family methyltransferase n=1 Tax=Jidongwangia harbinensis TaxID=2878561 RepID=UPI001CD988EB|nr:FkbM family methyltransferase [Jidongwangia harbinensis]MCA2214075.1 FkbM family methyltransferase [Jidongwangia harbinensis]